LSAGVIGTLTVLLFGLEMGGRPRICFSDRFGNTIHVIFIPTPIRARTSREKKNAAA
jgi:hypothetical protein